MKTMNIIYEDGRYVKKSLRNCDRVCNIADAKGKFKKERGAADGNFWRSLCEWLLEDAE